MYAAIAMNDDGQQTIVNTMVSRLLTTTEAANLSDLSTRMNTVEMWFSAKSPYLGNVVSADLKTDYNVVSTVLSSLVTAVNTTNAKGNQLANKVADIQMTLQTRGITLSS